MEAVKPSNGAAENASAQSFPERLEEMEDDISALQKRLQNSGGGGAQPSSFDARTLLARLECELSAEKRSREALNLRMESLEESIRIERHMREKELRNFSSELETTMRGLIGRIDTGLTIGAAAMRERTDATQARLRALINRVDDTLSTGVVSQSSEAGAGSADVMDSSSQAKASSSSVNTEAPPAPSMRESAMSKQLEASFARIRAQRQQINERCEQLGMKVMRSQGSPSPRALTHPVGSPKQMPHVGMSSPLSASPTSMQVPGPGFNFYRSGSLQAPVPS